MTELRTVTEGIALGESPRWHDGRLWFADWGAREVIAVSPDGEREVVVRMPSMPFSLDSLPDGRLVIISARDGRGTTS
jgi:sugar lactone lactonase YvrE